MARTVKLAPAEKSTAKAKRVVSPSRFANIRNSLPAIIGAVALVAAGALAGTALAHDGPGGSDGRHPEPAMEARMTMHRDHSGQHNSGTPKSRVGLTGTATSVSPTELSITLANGTSKTFVLDVMSQYFIKTTGTAADVTVGSYVLVDGGRPAGSAAVTAKGIAVLTSGRTDVRLHLGHPAKVTAVNGNTLTLEVAKRRGTKTVTVTINANTLISKIATATNADLTAGSSVIVDHGREAAAAKSVLIIR